jgi:uncharacterized membrane protein YdjX (TVP38/TMEM64 family)
VTTHRFLLALTVAASLAAAFLAAVLLGDGLPELWGQWSRRSSIEDVAASIRAYGDLSVAVSIGLMIAHSFLPFPAEIIAVANGAIYGFGYGTLITWIGAMLGAQAAFWTARVLGDAVIDRYVRAGRLQRIDRWIGLNGTAALLTARLIPLIAFNLVNYAAGLARVPWWTFTWTTAVGIAPLTFLMVAAGDRLKSLPLRLGAILLLGAVLIWMIVRSLRRNDARKKLKRRT